MATFGDKAMAGNKASPSLLMALPIWADRGIEPARYSEVVIICGPQPGIMPINTPAKGATAGIKENI